MLPSDKCKSQWGSVVKQWRPAACCRDLSAVCLPRGSKKCLECQTWGQFIRLGGYKSHPLAALSRIPRKYWMQPFHPFKFYGSTYVSCQQWNIEQYRSHLRRVNGWYVAVKGNSMAPVTLQLKIAAAMCSLHVLFCPLNTSMHIYCHISWTFHVERQQLLIDWWVDREKMNCL